MLETIIIWSDCYFALVIISTVVTWLDYIFSTSYKGSTIHNFYVSGKFTTRNIYRHIGCLKLLCRFISLIYILINPVWAIVYYAHNH